MDKKILKYKSKKNKLENDIINILNIKKSNYENEIANTNNKHFITDVIENYFNQLKVNQDLKLFIIVSGIYLVGKSTFINHLENFILKMSKICKNNEKSNLINKILYKINETNIDFIKMNKITIIEINQKNLIELNNNIKSNDNNIILNINIIPKNKNSLKNKYINEIIHDIKNNTSNFILNLDEYMNEYTQNNIELLKFKIKYVDDDFIFLNKTIDDILKKENSNIDLLDKNTIFYL